jgi:hypothetical protein
MLIVCHIISEKQAPKNPLFAAAIITLRLNDCV